MIKIIIIVLCIIGIIIVASTCFFWGYNDGLDLCNNQKSSTLILRLADEEEKFLLQYLTDEDVTLSSNGRIKGVFRNKASVTAFKDIKVKVTFYSKTDTPIQSQEYTIYEWVMPNEKKAFTLNVSTPEAHNSFSFEIIGATGDCSRAMQNCLY